MHGRRRPPHPHGPGPLGGSLLPGRRARHLVALRAVAGARDQPRLRARVQLLLPAAAAHVTISSSGDWLALAAFALAAVVTSQLAARERAEAEQATRRAAEAELGERLATLIANGSQLQTALPLLGRQAARALGARDGGIHLGPPAPSARAGRAVPIELDGRRLGELRLIDAPAGVADSADAARIGRILAGLIALG